MENMNQHAPEMELSAEELAEKKADMLRFYEESIPYLDAQLNYEKKLAEIDEVRFRRAQFQVQMAMMKYGRTTKMTSPPDKVVKNKDGTTTTTSGNIKATLSDWIQPEKTPAPKGYISQDDYNAYEAKKKEVMERNAAKYKPYNESMASYKQEQEDYASAMDQYKRAYDFYNQGPEPEKETEGSIKLTKGGKTRRGEDVTFNSAAKIS